MSQPRPEIELEQLIKNGVFTVERDRGGDYMLGYLIERDVTYIKELIAQEADKLANKRVKEARIEELKAIFEWGYPGSANTGIGTKLAKAPKNTIKDRIAALELDKGDGHA